MKAAASPLRVVWWTPPPLGVEGLGERVDHVRAEQRTAAQEADEHAPEPTGRAVLAARQRCRRWRASLPAPIVPRWSTMPSKRSPLVLYESLLAAVEGGDERDRVRTLRGLLRQPEAAWPPALREVVAGSGVGVGYLMRGLLSIHRFAPDVRRALAAGLPFAVARLVNGLPIIRGFGLRVTVSAQSHWAVIPATNGARCRPVQAVPMRRTGGWLGASVGCRHA